MAEKVLLSSAEYAHRAVEVASDKQAADIVMLDIRRVSDFADFFVILTAESRRQMETLAEEIRRSLKAEGASQHHREGTTESGWILLDFGDLIVHIFGPEEREYYQLDRVWSPAIEVVRLL